MAVMINNGTVEVLVGPAYAFTTPSYTGSLATFLARVRSIQVTDELQSTNTKGAGDTRARNRYHTGQGRLTLRGLVLGDGSYGIKPTTDGVTPVGLWIKVRTETLSTLTVGDTWEGVITRWQWSGDMDEAQIEEIEVDLDPDVA